MNPLFIARRYLFSPHSRSVVNLISGLSIAAVAMPVAAMIILLSVFNGFEGLVRSMYSTFDADLRITPRTGQTFGVGDIDTAALRHAAPVGALSYTLEQSALLRHGEHQTIIAVRGVDDNYTAVLPVGDAVTAGEWCVRRGDLEGLVVGEMVAHRLGVRSLADSDVDIYAIRRGYYSSLLPFENYNLRTVPVEGVFRLDQESEQQCVFVSLRLAQELFNHKDRASAIVVRLNGDADPAKAKREIGALVGDKFEVQTRDEQRQSFYRIMAYEKWGIFLIALMVLVVASFAVVGALSMLIAEKGGDRATLGALGASLPQIRSVFRCEGYLICLAGGVAGVVVGIAVTLAQQWLGIVTIPAKTFLVDSYPVELRGGDLLLVVAAFAAVSFVLCYGSVQAMIRKNN